VAAPAQPAAGPGAGLVVRDVAVRAVVVPLRRPLATRVGDFSRWPLPLIDVATEQGITGRSYLAPYLDRAAAALLPAIRDLGAGLRGVTGWLQAAGIAAACGIPMSSHLYPEVSGHLLRVTPTGQWLEWQDWAHPVLAHPFEVRAGVLHLSDVPGNGLEWDEDAVAHYQAQSPTP
jgi:L-alanine-DL-glutamate epimerase-like enolase superfamily enzyme